MHWLDGAELFKFQENIHLVQPFESDPYLTNLSDHEFRLIVAGGVLHAVAVLEAKGNHENAQEGRRILDELVAED